MALPPAGMPSCIGGGVIFPVGDGVYRWMGRMACSSHILAHRIDCHRNCNNSTAEKLSTSAISATGRSTAGRSAVESLPIYFLTTAISSSACASLRNPSWNSSVGTPKPIRKWSGDSKSHGHAIVGDNVRATARLKQQTSGRFPEVNLLWPS